MNEDYQQLIDLMDDDDHVIMVEIHVDDDQMLMLILKLLLNENLLHEYCYLIYIKSIF
jgi:hypothetical protein